MSFGGLLEHPGNDADELARSNNIHSIYPTGNEILVGSSAGLWVLAGNYLDVYGLQSNSEMLGEIASRQPLKGKKQRMSLEVQPRSFCESRTYGSWS